VPWRSLAVTDERQLEQMVTDYTMQGFTVVNRTAETVVLRKPKQFNVLLAVLGVLFCGVGLLVYAIVYSLQSDQTVEIRLESQRQSELRLSEDGRWWWDGERWQDTALSVPPGARRSDDDRHWWDGTNWRPVPTSERMWAIGPQGTPPQPSMQRPRSDEGQGDGPWGGERADG
jgi:hypothetical protein